MSIGHILPSDSFILRSGRRSWTTFCWNKHEFHTYTEISIISSVFINAVTVILQTKLPSAAWVEIIVLCNLIAYNCSNSVTCNGGCKWDSSHVYTTLRKSLEYFSLNLFRIQHRPLKQKLFVLIYKLFPSFFYWCFLSRYTTLEKKSSAYIISIKLYHKYFIYNLNDSKEIT